MLLFAGVEVGVRGHALPSGTRYKGDGGFGEQKRLENEEREAMKERMMIRCPPPYDYYYCILPSLSTGVLFN